MKYTIFKTSIGAITLIGDNDGLRRLIININDDVITISDDWVRDDDAFSGTKQQLTDYLAGDLERFTIKLNPQSTAFQQSVWNELLNIPYGTTISYKQLAARIGNENASRAVGLANGKNPIPIIIPCHRVVGSNGKLTGYAFGIELKKKLLDIEQKLYRYNFSML